MTLQLSVVVVAYDMARELPRTLATLATPYQRDIAPDAYEVIVVDNGSPVPVDRAVLAPLGSHARLARVDPAPPSPARAANLGIAEAQGDVIGLVIDGARMASPGLLHTALVGAGLGSRSVVASPAWHLGAAVHGQAADSGYNQEVEDQLLESVDWLDDGYRLFEVSTLANSSGRGWFGPMGESSALFLHRQLWDELGGLDERFDQPGGGLVNHDLYKRACESSDSQLVVTLGEGTFHQFHGGATTSAARPTDTTPEPAPTEAARSEYERLRGEAYRPPTNRPCFVGELHETLLPHLERSVALALDRRARGRTMFGPSAL